MAFEQGPSKKLMKVWTIGLRACALPDERLCQLGVGWDMSPGDKHNSVAQGVVVIVGVPARQFAGLQVGHR